MGNLRRMGRALLPFSLHCSESKGAASAVLELKEMLKHASSLAEASAIECALVQRLALGISDGRILWSGL